MSETKIAELESIIAAQNVIIAAMREMITESEQEAAATLGDPWSADLSARFIADLDRRIAGAQRGEILPAAHEGC